MAAKPIFWPLINAAHGKRWKSKADLASEMRRREAREWGLGVMCCWERRSDLTAQLQPARPEDVDFSEELGEFWACMICGRVTRNPRNSQPPDGPVIRHYMHCTEANWRTCEPSSSALGFAVEFCDGVDARRWRCATCRREYTDKEAIRFVDDPATRSDFLLHRRTCANRITRAATKEKTQALLMRNREVLGQTALFTKEDCP